MGSAGLSSSQQELSENAVAETVKVLVADSLGVARSTLELDTPLIGHMIELDSMAVVAIILALESEFGIIVHDDEFSSNMFESVQTLVELVQEKRSA